MRRFAGLNDIVQNGFCTSCGLCTTCAPEGVVQMGWSDAGQLRPRTSRPLTPDEDAAVLQLCPGVNMTGPFGGQRGGREGMSDVWGELRRVVTAWAGDAETRFAASTGGVMTSVNRYLLESGRAAFILQVRASAGTESEPVLVRDPSDLIAGSQSRYASSAPLTAVREALEMGEPFAVSLKPCDIAGIRNLQRVEERARRLIVFTQTMLCGTVPSLDMVKDWLKRRDVDPERDRPQSFRWRGDGCPGPTVARLGDGRELTGTYNELWVDNPWTTQFRCKVCPDAVGLQADLATGDSWPNGFADGESAGTNVLVARSELGSEVLAECERLGYLTVREADARVLDHTQPHHVRLRRSVGARLAGAVAGGAPVPEFAGLGEDACARELGSDELAEVFRGALERFRAGQGDECTPMEDWQGLFSRPEEA